MTLDPLATAPLAVQLHVATVIPAAILGAFVLAARKGTSLHRLLGRVWICLMVATALISFFIRDGDGPFGLSFIHLLSIVTLVGCWQVVGAARRRAIKSHSRNVVSLYVGAIVIAGAFTLVPGRRMHDVVFSGPDAWLVVVPVAALAAILAFVRLRHGRPQGADTFPGTVRYTTRQGAPRATPDP